MIQRDGYALLIALLFVMALAVLGMGVTAIGIRESQIAEAVQRHRQARALAEAAALDVVADWSGEAYSALEAGAAVDVPTAIDGAILDVVRLDTSLLAVRSTWTEPNPDAPPVSAHAALLVQTVDPASVAAAFPDAASATHRAELYGGTVSGEDACGPIVAGVRAPEIVHPGGAVVLGAPPTILSAPLAGAAAAVLGPSSAPRLATGTPTPAVVTPGSSATGDSCDPGGWGSAEAGHPCHDDAPLVHSPGSLTLSGGSARAILVVEGDLRLEDGVRVEGLVVVRGTLRVTGGSRIDGAVRAGTLILESGVVRRSRCSLLAVLSAPALDRPFRPPGRWWIPAF